MKNHGSFQQRQQGHKSFDGLVIGHRNFLTEQKGEGSHMLLRVLLNDGYYDYVKSQHLERLINTCGIISFYRKNGVVVLGVDRVRSSQEGSYAGSDRRETDH